MTSALQYKLFVTSQIPQSGRGPLPDGSTRMWSPIISTLILGSREAVLVDPPLTNTQAAEVGDWIETSGRRLRQIYITHGHGDHWFGAIPLVERFSGVAVRATEGTKQLMAAQNSASSRRPVADRRNPRLFDPRTPITHIVDSSRSVLRRHARPAPQPDQPWRAMGCRDDAAPTRLTPPSRPTLERNLRPPVENRCAHPVCVTELMLDRPQRDARVLRSHQVGALSPSPGSQSLVAAIRWGVRGRISAPLC